VSSLADLTLVAWALVEVGVRVREGVQARAVLTGIAPRAF
jgi:hypothetical protein